MENEKQEKLKKILKKAVDIKKNSDLAIAREFVDLDEKIEHEFDELKENIEIINDSLKKKLESELVLEIDKEELKGDKGDKGNKGDKGDKGDTQIVEKVIEKREIIKEQPIVYKNVTNEIKEVAKYEERDQIVTKINSGKDKDIKIEAKQITGLPEFTREVVREVGSVGHIETPLKAGANVTITTDGTGAKVINASGDMLKSTYDPAGGNRQVAFILEGDSYMEYTLDGSDNITNVDYWTDSGKGTKLFSKVITWTGSNPTTIVLTDEIASKTLTTTIAYSGDTITNVTKVLS